jgi:hypothetical protein
MGHWQLQTMSGRHDGKLFGKYGDDDLKQRLFVLTSQLLTAERGVAEAQKLFDATIASAQPGQEHIADAALKLLAEKRAR